MGILNTRASLRTYCGGPDLCAFEPTDQLVAQNRGAPKCRVGVSTERECA